VVKVILRHGESIQLAVRRFRKYVEKSGIKREMRRRAYYEKPSETKRRARLLAEVALVSTGRYWVASDRLTRRTKGPCRSIGQHQ
jgi:small subunit ribosomal protein S21